MKKLILAIFLCIFLLTSCVWDKDAAIFLSTEPAFSNSQTVFKQRQKIYYALVSKEPIESEKLRLQVLRIDKISPAYKVEFAYGMDMNRGAQKQYVTDYFTLHKAGTYFIRIFSFDNLEVPLAETEFTVEGL
ncbi:MAG: hypothetical protein A2Y25_09510 [Candidatus Melainabacteria bacterium GWF2_37_15]|nr:MAG: hypothetical protein A2Y25_09510 [Candidatus Melainabacteria bacterium GWF2_37_15]